MNLSAKTCPACQQTFAPTSGSQQRCVSCIEARLIKGPRPACRCGCGGLVVSDVQGKRWNKFIHGHHARMPGHHPARGVTPWNKGSVTRYDFVCEACKKPFQSKLKAAKFCTPECYAQTISGAGSPHWKGGERTTYRSISVDGVMVREHRVVMAKVLARALNDQEVVHHIDGNGLNNAPENLHLFHCEACHQFFHKTGATLTYSYER